jgi:hypothetical protein
MGLCLTDANNLLNRAVIFVLIQLKPVSYMHNENENENERFDDVFVIGIVFVLVRHLSIVYIGTRRIL